MTKTNKTITEVIVENRIAGKTIKAVGNFFFEGKQGKAVIFKTPKGDFLSPKAVENLIKTVEKRTEARIELVANKFVGDYVEKYQGCGMADSMLAITEMLEAITNKDNDND